MQARDFCFWLQGYFEIAGDKELSAEQAAVIKQHLVFVFKRDDTMGAPAHPVNLFGGPPITWKTPPSQTGGASFIPDGKEIFFC